MILAPVIPDGRLLADIGKGALKKRSLLGATLLTFENHSLLAGFIGYPHLLTLLEFIAAVREKEFYFLGLAGSLVSRFRPAQTVNVSQIRPSGVFSRFSRVRNFQLKPFPDAGVSRAPAVSVDLIQRETPSWLRRQVRNGVALVEMEIFPLRVYLGKPFTALVVVSDRVTEKGIVPSAKRKDVAREFLAAYDLIRRQIDHG